MEDLLNRIEGIKKGISGIGRITEAMKKETDIFETFEKVKDLTSDSCTDNKLENANSLSWQKSHTAYQAVKEQVKNMVDTYGIEIYNDKNLINALISDYITFDVSARKILADAINENITIKLFAIKDLNDTDKNLEISKIKYYYMQEKDIQEDIADFVIDCFI